MNFLLILLLSVSVFAGPSGSSCDYYQELEETYHCGARGYPLNFGQRLCERYLDQERAARLRVRNWFPKVRLCLQEYLETNRGSFRDCDDLHRRALRSHLRCYKSTGFCELSLRDELQILGMTGKDVLRPAVLSLSLQLKASCRK